MHQFVVIGHLQHSYPMTSHLHHMHQQWLVIFNPYTRMQWLVIFATYTSVIGHLQPICMLWLVIFTTYISSDWPSSQQTPAVIGHLHRISHLNLCIYLWLRSSLQVYNHTDIQGWHCAFQDLGNDPKFREIPCGSSHGFGTATSIAKLFGILSNGGMHEGKRLLSMTAIARLNEPLSVGWDNVLRMQITYGRGVTLREVNPVRLAFSIFHSRH